MLKHDFSRRFLWSGPHHKVTAERLSYWNETAEAVKRKNKGTLFLKAFLFLKEHYFAGMSAAAAVCSSVHYFAGMAAAAAVCSSVTGDIDDASEKRAMAAKKNFTVEN